MADLISRAAVLNGISDLMKSPWYNDGKGGERHVQYLARKDAVEVVRVLCVEKETTVDAVPVIHARWINYPECLGYDGAYTDEHIVCSACHSVWNIIDNETDGFNHCPACGAKMDGEQEAEEG